MASAGISATDDIKNSGGGRYLTLAPRGFESFVSENIQSTLISSGYSCSIEELGSSPISKLHDIHQHQSGALSSDDDPLDDVAARIEYNKARKKRKLQNKMAKGSKPTGGSQQHQHTKVNQQCNVDDFKAEIHDLSHSVGSVHLPEIDSDVSLGYHTTKNYPSKLPKRILSIPGNTEGCVLISFCTNAPPSCVASMKGMGCGPLLALITSSKEEILQLSATLEQSMTSIEHLLKDPSNNYFEKFQSAMQLWKRHVNEVWFVPDSIYGVYRQSSTMDTAKVTQPPFAYRLSCMRTHSKKYSYKRELLLPHLASLVIPWDDLHRMNLNGDGRECNEIKGTRGRDENDSSTAQHPEWHVNLTDYDLEILTIIHSQCVSVAIPLRPYQHWGSKAYSSNTIPTDGSGSFGRLGADPISGSRSSVHLRPSVAGTLMCKTFHIRFGATCY